MNEQELNKEIRELRIIAFILLVMCLVLLYYCYTLIEHPCIIQINELAPVPLERIKP